MKIITPLLLLTAVLIAPISTLAASPTEDFSVCVVDALNGKERKEFARLVFFAMAAHPEIQSFSKVTESDLDGTQKSIGEVFTRLLTVECAKELKAANDSDPLALQKAFELVGRVAMQELMNNAAVVEAMSGFAKHADMEAIQKAISAN